MKDTPLPSSYHRYVHLDIDKTSSNATAQLHDLVIMHPTLTARQKAVSAIAMAEADKALCDGADEELWVLEVALRVHKVVSGS